jgi:hypothetical protein
MLRDNPTGSSQQCLENPRPAGAELSLTEDVTSPFQAEPRQPHFWRASKSLIRRVENPKLYLPTIT